jgi:hypothetical protein
MKNYLSIIGIVFLFFLLIRVFKKPIRQWVYNLRAKLRVRSLRTAIGEADKNKSETGRKNIVVFNQGTGYFEPVTKRLLKAASNASKNKNNAAKTKARKRRLAKKKTKKREFTNERVKQIERKSLYVTE